jgi:hypothetical protein
MGSFLLSQAWAVLLMLILVCQSSGPETNLTALTALDAESAKVMSVVFMIENQTLKGTTVFGRNRERK